MADLVILGWMLWRWWQHWHFSHRRHSHETLLMCTRCLSDIFHWSAFYFNFYLNFVVVVVVVVINYSVVGMFCSVYGIFGDISVFSSELIAVRERNRSYFDIPNNREYRRFVSELEMIMVWGSPVFIRLVFEREKFYTHTIHMTVCCFDVTQLNGIIKVHQNVMSCLMLHYWRVVKFWPQPK